MTITRGVTDWSKFGTRFTGVSVDTLLEQAGPIAEAGYQNHGDPWAGAAKPGRLMTIPVRGVARASVPGPWQSAIVLQVRAETADAETLRLMLADARPHLADLDFWRRRHVRRW